MNEKLIKLYIDDREDEKRIRNIQEYNEEDYRVEIRHLKYGDYHYITDKGTRVVWEFKTGSDFISSIQDNHLHNQVYQMKRHYDYTFLMVVVSDWKYLLGSFKQYTGIDLPLKRIAGELCWFGCHTSVITCKNLSNAMYMMKRQSEKLIDNKPLLYKFNRKNENYAINRLNCVYGISGEIATKIAETLDLHTEKDLMNLTVDDLRTVDKIGIKKAEQILSQLKGV